MLNRTESRRAIRDRICFTLLLIPALVSGCGGTNGPQRPELAPVKGIVMYNGVPIEGAVVEFVREGSPVRSMATTDGAGRYALTSYRAGDGAPVGTYQITVSKRTVVPTPEADPIVVPPVDTSNAQEGKAAKMKQFDEQLKAKKMAARARSGKSRNLLPAKYADPKTSGLTFEVKAGVENEFPIALAD